mgnify:CR=1 FL=1
MSACSHGGNEEASDEDTRVDHAAGEDAAESKRISPRTATPRAHAKDPAEGKMSADTLKILMLSRDLIKDTTKTSPSKGRSSKRPPKDDGTEPTFKSKILFKVRSHRSCAAFVGAAQSHHHAVAAPCLFSELDLYELSRRELFLRTVA